MTEFMFCLAKYYLSLREGGLSRCPSYSNTLLGFALQAFTHYLFQFSAPDRKALDFPPRIHHFKKYLHACCSLIQSYYVLGFFSGALFHMHKNFHFHLVHQVWLFNKADETIPRSALGLPTIMYRAGAMIVWLIMSQDFKVLMPKGGKGKEKDHHLPSGFHFD